MSFIRGIKNKNKQIKNKFIIFDDMMDSLNKDDSKLLRMLTTRGSHHLSISCMYLVQNAFFGDRTARVNSLYTAIFKNPADQLQISNLARQMFPKKCKIFP